MAFYFGISCEKSFHWKYLIKLTDKTKGDDFNDVRDATSEEFMKFFAGCE